MRSITFLLGWLSLTALAAPGCRADAGRPASIAPHDAPTPGLAVLAGDPVDLSSGLYIRSNIDLVLDDTPPVIFKRVYRNHDDRSRPFGIGTNHTWGTFLVGDAPIFSFIDLILEDGGRVHYARVTPGTGLRNAEFEHTATPSEYLGSRLSWNGDGWTIRMKDGSKYFHPPCESRMQKPCTVSDFVDAEGHRIHVTHDERLNAVRIESEHRQRIDLTYDEADRIVLAKTGRQEVRYAYDSKGRLVKVTNSDGEIEEYGYDDRHQMTFLREPGITIRNTFDDNWRVLLNDSRIESREKGKLVEKHLVFKFGYTIDRQGRITAVDMDGPAGRQRTTFNAQGYVVAQGAAAEGAGWLRDESNTVRGVTVWCSGNRSVKVTAPLDATGSEESIRKELARVCRETAGPARRK